LLFCAIIEISEKTCQPLQCAFFLPIPKLEVEFDIPIDVVAPPAEGVVDPLTVEDVDKD